MPVKSKKAIKTKNIFDKIYTLGPKGTYSNQAATLVADNKIKNIKYTLTIPQITTEVQADESALGVLPIENSTSGVVEPAQDSLVESNVIIIKELMIKVEYNLVSNVPLDKIKIFYSHNVAFNQTMKFTASKIPKAEVVFSNSNIHSADLLLENSDEPVAAIVPSLVSLTNPLLKDKVVATKIQDYENNTTRFFAIKKRPKHIIPDFTAEKTSIFVALHDDRHSLLFDMLREFHVYGINLCRLESRPSKGNPWQYSFFIDFFNNHRVEKCLESLRLQDIEYRFLGSYNKLK